MAKEKDKRKTTTAETHEIIEQYKGAIDYQQPVRDTWEDKEKIIYSKTGDSISDRTKSRVNDPRLLSILTERSFRVMSQLASGKVRALSSKDKGKSTFMDLVLHNYIEPNANTQFDILTKFRMVDFYSLVYGTFGVLVDYVVRDDYVGPDFYLIPIRNLIPQPGRFSIKDSDYVFVKSKVTRSWLKKRDKKVWQNIDKLMDLTKGESKNLQDADVDEQSFAEQQFGGEFSENDDKYQQITIVTRYERDRWLTFAPDYNLVLRDMDNPHENHKIPVVVKHAFPLIDRFYGLGEIEKGKTLQYAINSLINLYLDGVKMSIFPPTKIDMKGVVPSTIKMSAGAKWVMKNMDAVQAHVVSPQGINSFQSTYSFLIAALMNQAGTTDTTTGKNVDPGMGKTPQALELLSQRQNARDAYDRFMMEQFIEDVYNLFLDLIVLKQEKPIEVHLFDEEIQRIQKANPDILEIFESGEAGKVTIKADDLKGAEYKFYIDAGSTYKKDQVLENQSLKEVMELVMQLPGGAEQIVQTGAVQIGENVIDFGEVFKRFLITRGIQDWDKIIEPVETRTGPKGGQGQPQGQGNGTQYDPRQDPEFMKLYKLATEGGPTNGNIRTNNGGRPAQPNPAQRG